MQFFSDFYDNKLNMGLNDGIFDYEGRNPVRSLDPWFFSSSDFLGSFEAIWLSSPKTGFLIKNN